NGKSTFVNTIRGILGDYATVADMATFVVSQTQQHPTDLAKLRGARLVVAQETQKGRRWDETKIKASPAATKSRRDSCARTSLTSCRRSNCLSAAITNRA